MEKNDKIYIAGHTGLVGSTLLKKLEKEGYTNLVYKKRYELNLTNQQDVIKFFEAENPKYVFLCAALVGGIKDNDTRRGDFIYKNLMIQNNIIDASMKYGTQKLLFLGSSCIYPRDCPQPIKEEYLLTGPLEQTNEPYAIAKIAGVKLIESYRRQFYCDFISVMPTNLYGSVNDNYDLETSHVFAAMLRKFHEAKINNTDVILWGDGSPYREFLFVEDLADALIFLMDNYSHDDPINVGTGKDISIKELSEKIAKVIGFKGNIIWDTTKPNGTPRKRLDVSRLENMGWKYKTELEDGIKIAYQYFLDSLKN